MHVGEYLQGLFRAWGVTDAQLADVALDGVDPHEEYTAENRQAVWKAMVPLLEQLILAPYQKTISENGFSVSWDFGNVGRFYMWLCRRLGITPNEDVLDALDVSTITDRSDMW